VVATANGFRVARTVATSIRPRARDTYPPPQICLSVLQNREPGFGTGAAYSWRFGDAGTAGTGAGDQVLRSHRCTGNQIFAGIVSSWNARRWLDGSAGRDGGSKRCTICCARKWLHRSICLLMTLRFRCLTPEGVGRKLADCGCMPVTSEVGVDRHRRQPFTCSR
jgi:hypothetical protein